MNDLLKPFSHFIRVLLNAQLFRKIKTRDRDIKGRSTNNRTAGCTDRRATEKQKSEQQAAALQREIRSGRKFTLAEAIGREGGSFMKGESSIPRPLRATTQINQFIAANTSDPTSAFVTTLSLWVNNDIRVSRQLDTPLVALTQVMESTLKEPTSFTEFSRQVAIAQAKLTGDRPYFQQLNQPPHPEADYTHESIKTELLELLKVLKD